MATTNNPYTISRCRDCDIAHTNLAKAVAECDLCEACRLIRSQWENNSGAAERLRRYDKKQWQHTYVSSDDSGYVATHIKRIEESKASNAELKKFEKELRMCKIIADNSHDVQYLQSLDRQRGQTYDITVDGIKTDLKCIDGGAGNMVKYAKKAFTKQGSEAVVFELPRIAKEYYGALSEIRRKYTGRIFFYFKDENILKEII